MKNPVFDLSTCCISKAVPEDIPSIFLLQKRAFVQEAEIDHNYSITPVMQTRQSFEDEFGLFTYLKATVNNCIIGSIRASLKNGSCFIGRLIVEPVFQKYGIGKKLLMEIESEFQCAEKFELFTAEQSEGNVRFYKNNGYSVYDKFSDESGVVLLKFEKLTKRN